MVNTLIFYPPSRLKLSNFSTACPCYVDIRIHKETNAVTIVVGLFSLDICMTAATLSSIQQFD